MLLEHLRIFSSAQHGGADFYRGTLEGQDVVLCRSGVGKVQAAQAARMLLDLYRVRCLIWVGSAGSLVRDVAIGDVVLSTWVQQYDVDFSKIGYPPGVIPLLPTSVFPADPNLRRIAERAAEGLQADFHTFSGKIVTVIGSSRPGRWRSVCAARSRRSAARERAARPARSST